MTIQNPWDAAKAVLRGKFTAIQSYLKKQGKHQTDYSTSKAAGKRRTKSPPLKKSPQSQQKERNHKYQSRNK